MGLESNTTTAKTLYGLQKHILSVVQGTLSGIATNPTCITTVSKHLFKINAASQYEKKTKHQIDSATLVQILDFSWKPLKYI